MIRVDADHAAVQFPDGRRIVRLPVADHRAAAAAHLVRLYDERNAYAAAVTTSDHPGEAARAALDKGDELDAACEDFRRRYYPRRHRVIVGQRQVFTCSATMRSITTVWAPGVAA